MPRRSALKVGKNSPLYAKNFGVMRPGAKFSTGVCLQRSRKPSSNQSRGGRISSGTHHMTYFLLLSIASLHC